MATTAIIPIHAGKGRPVAATLKMSVGYIKNSEKTDNGQWVTAYACDPLIADNEFMFSKNQYAAITGRSQGTKDILAYHLRIAFKPGEIDAKKANQIGYDLAMKLTHGYHAFVCCTHTDRGHIHSHIIVNSTSLDCTRKFRNFKNSSFAIRRIADKLCLENGLSIVENPKPSPGKDYGKWLGGEKAPTMRDKLCELIDNSISADMDFEQFILRLKEQGVDVKRGKQISLKIPGAERFARLDTLGDNYSEAAIRERLSDERIIVKKSDSKTLVTPIISPEKPSLLIDIQSKITQGYSGGFIHWAKVENLKQSAKTLLYLREVGIDSYAELIRQYNNVQSEFSRRSERIKKADEKMAAISDLQKQIGTYSKTRNVYAAYKRSGFDQAFFEANAADIILHKTAKKYFDNQGFKGKLPSINSLKEAWGNLAKEKRKLYAGYKELRDRDRALAAAKHNCDKILNISHEELDRQRKNRAESQER